MFLDGVIGRPPSRTYGFVRLTQGGSLYPCQKQYLKAYRFKMVSYATLPAEKQNEISDL